MSNKLQKPIANRPHDPMALAKLVGDIATGHVVDEVSNNVPARNDYSALDAQGKNIDENGQRAGNQSLQIARSVR